MQKAIKIKIRDVALTIEEEASTILENYLSSIRQHFLKYKDGDEIISDIEIRIAEKALRLLKDKDDILSKTQVEKVIEEIGEVDEMDESSLDEKVSFWKSLKYKLENFKLLRDTSNQQIAGVCAGLGMYFNIDPVVFRFIFGILFVAGIFFNIQLSIFVIAIYTVLWIAMPAAKTPVQRLEMKGESVTLAKIEEEIKLDKEISKKDVGVIARSANELQFIVSRMYRKIVVIIKFLIRLTAYLSIIPIFLFFFGTAIVYFMFMMNPNLAGLGEIFFGPETLDINFKYLIITLGFIAFIIPTFLAFVGAISIIRKRNLFKPIPTIGAVLIWVLVSAGLFAFGYNTRERYIQSVINNQENYEMVAKEYEDIDWNKIENIYISGNFNVRFDNSPVNSLSLLANEYSWKNIEVMYSYNTLAISRKQSSLFIPELEGMPVSINLNMSELNGSLYVNVSTGQITTEEPLKAKEITLNGLLNEKELVIETEKFNLTANSFYSSYFETDPTITVSGTATEQIVNLYGRSYDASSLESKNVVINIQNDHSSRDSNTSVVNASERLVVKIWDDELKYIGDPEVSKTIFGDGKVTKLEI